MRVGGAAERTHRGKFLWLGAREEPGGRKALLHCGPNPRVLLGVQGFFEQRRLTGGRMPQGILRSREPGGGVGAEQGEFAERGFDRPAQTIIDPDSLGCVRRHARNLGPGDRVDQLCCVVYQDAAIRRLDQPAVFQGRQDHDAPLVAQLAERDDGPLLFGKTAAGQRRQSGREFVGVRRQYC